MKLEHVGIEVLDLFTEELFYRTAFGFSPRYRYVSRNSPGLRTVFLERGYPNRAVIIDLDGTLLDTEDNYYEADRRLLAEHGILFSKEEKRRYIGGSNWDMMVDVRRRFALAATPEELVLRKNAIYLE